MIKLELNSTDELALRHMGNALTAMAVELNGQVPKPSLIASEPNVTDADAKSYREAMKVHRSDGAHVTQGDSFTDSLKYPSDEEATEMIQDIIEENGDECKVDDPLDSNGLPWDGRIHSSSKAKIKDGSWKKRKGVDAETLATVEAELTALMAIPVETVTGDADTLEAIDETPPPPPTPIVPKPQCVIPPPPPVDAAPAGCTPDAVEAVSFVEITRFITGTMVKERGWKIPEVNAILTEQYGVTFQTLKAREDLYDTVLNFLKEQPSK